MRLRRGRTIGKYRILRPLGEGGFGRVYAARDTVEGRTFALKVIGAGAHDPEVLGDFLREVRLVSPLEHPNILPIRNADIIDGICLAASPIGRETLGDRLQRRLPPRTALGYAGQLLEGLAYAHERNLLHCDIKPDNLILFPNDRLRIGDFGLAKVAARTIAASGSGTIGYLAPEQALGKPSLRSDVFCAALLIYRMFSGRLPEWPFDWPPAGHDRARRVLHADVLALLRRALHVDARKRFASAVPMRDEWRRLRPRALRELGRPRKRTRRQGKTEAEWRAMRQRHFKRQHGQGLALRFECSRCHGPVSEAMAACPWCGRGWKTHRAETREPHRCKRCKRGVKADWKFCPWCWGGAIGPKSDREYGDRRYTHRCSNRACSRRDLMPWMRYCPWCRTKVKRPWKNGLPDGCPSCRWGVAGSFWSHCPWCTKKLGARR